MSGLVDSRENAILNLLWGAQALTPPATWYIGLMIATPTEAGTYVEPSGGSYARVAIANNLTQWPSAVNGEKANANAILFPTASASWGTVTHYGFFDALTSGSLWAWAVLDTSRTISAGDAFQFLAGDCKVACD